MSDRRAMVTCRALKAIDDCCGSSGSGDGRSKPGAAMVVVAPVPSCPTRPVYVLCFAVALGSCVVALGLPWCTAPTTFGLVAATAAALDCVAVQWLPSAPTGGLLRRAVATAPTLPLSASVSICPHRRPAAVVLA